jgi:outer membrane protein assembly factor BamD
MINMFPDSTLVPRAKQKLRDVQEVMAEREADIGLYYESRENYNAAIARLETVTDTYPLYSKSDQALLGIGDAYAGEAHACRSAQASRRHRERLHGGVPGQGRAGLRQGHYPLSHGASRRRCPRPPGGHEPPRSRAHRGSCGRERCESAAAAEIAFTDKTFDIIKHGPMVVEAVHVGEPSLEDPKRTLAPEITKQNIAMFTDAVNAKPPAPARNRVPHQRQ